MAGLCRIISRSVRAGPLAASTRPISLSAVNNLKEIHVTRNDKEMVIEGVFVESPRTKLLVKPEPLTVVNLKGEEKEPCYMCALDLDIKHTDVLILSQFVRSDGCMLPRKVTGLCKMQQYRMNKLVTMAHKAGLMMNLKPDNCKGDPRLRRDWKKFNTYYDEKTIFAKKKETWLQKWKKHRPARDDKRSYYT